MGAAEAPEWAPERGEVKARPHGFAGAFAVRLRDADGEPHGFRTSGAALADQDDVELANVTKSAPCCVIASVASFRSPLYARMSVSEPSGVLIRTRRIGASRIRFSAAGNLLPGTNT